MAEDVVIRYRAEVDEAIRKMDLFAKENDQLASSSVKAGKAIDQEAKSVDKLEKELVDTGKKLKDASTQSQDFSNKATSTFTKVGGALKTFASGAALALGAAFSVTAIQAFASASIDAFLDAEKNAERLKFAITTIGGESEAVYERLIQQSAQLQKITIFSDDSIQQAQAALSAFGLTGKEIDKLIPKLADFATVSGLDITQAAQKVGSALEGNGREFKKYAIEVSATASRQENLNSLIDGFTQFTGAAENATKTLSGQLQVLNNRSDELQETLGSKLAPIWAKIKIGVFEAGIEVLKFFKIIDEADEADSDRVDTLTKSFDNLAARLKEAGKDVGVEFGKAIEDNTKQIEQAKIKNDELTASIEKRIAVISRSTANINPADDQLIKSLTKQREENDKIIKILQQKISVMQGVIDIEKQAASSSEVLTEASDERVAGSAKEVESLKRLGAEYKALLELIKDPAQKQLLELDILSEVDFEAFKQKVAELAAKQGNEITIPAKLDIPSDRVVDEGYDMGLVFGESFGEGLARVLDENAVLIASLQDIAQQFAATYREYTKIVIDDIEKEKEAQLTSIDEQLEANEQALEKRRISETEASINEKKLLDEKVKAEQVAAKKEQEIKRKAALADKAAALIQITINTAEAVSKALTAGPVAGIALAALYAALGAAQAAIVVAQPVPYAKGTKSAKEGLSRVGEQGEEIMYTPAGTKVLPNNKTKKYAEVLDSMFDNRFEAYVLNRYVNPALVKQQKQYESQKSVSFADNLGRSMVANSKDGKVDPALIRAFRSGSPVTNADEIGQAVAKALPQPDIYRR